MASLKKRIVAYLLDILLVYTLASLVVSIKYINPSYKKYTKLYTEYNASLKSYYNKEIDEKEMTKINKESTYYLTKYSIVPNIATIVVLIGYYGFFQKYNNGQTLGKKINKIKVVDNNSNENPKLGTYLLRLLPMQFIFIGNIIALILNTTLVNFLGIKQYFIANSIITYTFTIISLISFIMLLTRKDRRCIQDIICNTKVVDE